MGTWPGLERRWVVVACICADFGWLHAHTFFPFISTETVAKNQCKGRGTLPCLPFAKMFLLEFYFISLDFDGFIVCPWVRSNGVTAASFLWLPSRNDASEMRMQILNWLLRKFGKCRREWVGDVPLKGGGCWRVSRRKFWGFVCCYTELHTHSLRCIAWHLLLIKSIAAIYLCAGGNASWELWRWLLLHTWHDFNSISVISYS